MTLNQSSRHSPQLTTLILDEELDESFQFFQNPFLLAVSVDCETCCLLIIRTCLSLQVDDVDARLNRQIETSFGEQEKKKLSRQNC